MKVKEFMFLISVRVPSFSSPAGRTDTLTSQRMDPSCIRQSEIPMYFIIS